MYEIKVKIKHDCPYLSIANLFDFPVYSYCSDYYDLMVIPKKITAKESENISVYVEDKTSLEIVSGGNNSSNTYVYFRCMCRTVTAISPRVQKHGGLVEHPIVHKDGWEYHKIICLNNKTQSAVLKFLQTLEEYELVSIKDLGREGIFKSQFVSAHELVENLTDRQIEVLTKAFEGGYYEIPRTIKTEEIASSFNVSRAASEKSLRKAENAIMKVIMPYLLFHQRIKSDSTSPAKIKLTM